MIGQLSEAEAIRLLATCHEDRIAQADPDPRMAEPLRFTAEGFQRLAHAYNRLAERADDARRRQEHANGQQMDQS